MRRISCCVTRDFVSSLDAASDNFVRQLNSNHSKNSISEVFLGFQDIWQSLEKSCGGRSFYG